MLPQRLQATDHVRPYAFEVAGLRNHQSERWPTGTIMDIRIATPVGPSWYG